MYKEGQKYNLKYINMEGKEVETTLIPEKEMSKPEVIMKLKNENKDFFKLLESKFIEKESKNMKNLYDVLEDRDFEDIDIADVENGDLLVAFCLDPENGDSDIDARVLTKIAKELEVYEVQEDVVICKVSDWVRKHKEVLTDLFEEDDEDYLVSTAFPGIVSGYITDDAYNELDSKLTENYIVMEDIDKEVKTEDYTAREQFDARISKRSEEDKANIKVVAETEHYLLTIAKDKEKPDRLYLDITAGKTDDRMLPDVYIKQDYKGKCETAEINWGAFGSCDVTETLTFIKYLTEATDFCSQIEGKDFSDELDY